MTAEIADAWLPVSITHPAKARERWGQALAAGLAKRAPERGPLAVYAGSTVDISEGLEPLRELTVR
jgi:hypothetical protein